VAGIAGQEHAVAGVAVELHALKLRRATGGRSRFSDLDVGGLQARAGRGPQRGRSASRSEGERTRMG
jgi:hypothetical protein